tara:strand:- start:9522 stop:12152 length:2631 start_codon:yes stop_codon:yes gene_type:complete
MSYFLHGPGSQYEINERVFLNGEEVAHRLDPGPTASTRAIVFPRDPGAFLSHRWGGLPGSNIQVYNKGQTLLGLPYYPNTISGSRNYGSSYFSDRWNTTDKQDPYYWLDFHNARWVIKSVDGVVKHTYLTPADISGQENTATSYMQMPLRTHPFRYGAFLHAGYNPNSSLSRNPGEGMFYNTALETTSIRNILFDYDGDTDPVANKRKKTLQPPPNRPTDFTYQSKTSFSAAEKHKGEIQQGSIAYFANPRMNLFLYASTQFAMARGFESTGVNFTAELVSISYNPSETIGTGGNSVTGAFTTIQIKNIRNSQYQDFSTSNTWTGSGGFLTNANQHTFGMPHKFSATPTGSGRWELLGKNTGGLNLDNTSIPSLSTDTGSNNTRREGSFHGQRILPVPNAVYDSGESHQSNPDGAVFSVNNSLEYDHGVDGFSLSTNPAPYTNQGFVKRTRSFDIIDDGTGGGSSTFTLQLKVHGKLTATVGNRLQFAHSHLSDFGPEFSSGWVMGPHYKRDAGGVKNTGPGHTVKVKACNANFDADAGTNTAWGVRDNGEGFSEFHIPNTPYGSYQTINGPISNVYIASHTTAHSHSNNQIHMDTNHATRDDVLTVKVKPLSDQSVFLIKITGELHHDASSTYGGMYLVCEHITDPQPSNSSTFKNSNDTSTANGCFQVGNMMHNQKGLYPCYNTDSLVIDSNGFAVAQYGEVQQSTGGTYSENYYGRTNVTQGASTLVPDTWPNNNTTATNQQPYSNQTTLYEGNTDGVAINTNAMRDQGCGFSRGGTTRIYPFTSSVMMHRPGVTGFIRYSIRTVEENNAGTVQFGATTNGAISNMIVEELTHPYGNLGFDIPGGLDTTQHYAGHEMQYDWNNPTSYKIGPSN